MGLFDKRFQKLRSRPATAPPVDMGFDPTSHHRVFDYIKAQWNGDPTDPKFEELSLERDLHFNSLNLAELIYAVAQVKSVPITRVVDWLRIGIPGGGDTKLATLVERVSILANTFEETDRIKLLASGIVGNGQELLPILSDFDSVDFAVRYCNAIAQLGALKDHDAIDAMTGTVQDDPRWK